MDKIDNSTYLQIKKDKKQKNRSAKGKGMYGHSKHYRNSRLIMVIFILALIVSDVVFSIVVFHTRKTLFVIVACVLSIPFARNLIDLFMSFKAKPLDLDEYKETQEISKLTEISLLYDITITDTDGIVYIPCLAVYNNNIICYTPDEKTAKDREKIKKYISDVNNISKTNYRIFVTEKRETFKKELRKLHAPDDATAKSDEKVMENLLGMGF